MGQFTRSPFCLAWAKSLALFLVIGGAAFAQTTISVTDAIGTWNAWTKAGGATMTDAPSDQQTGQKTDDFASDATYASFYQKAGKLNGGTDYILWRARFDDFSGTTNKFGGNGGNLGLGMDLDGNGSVDLIMMFSENGGNVNNRVRTVTFGDPGTGANTGPSTTTWTFPGTIAPTTLTANTDYQLIQTTDGSNINGTPDSWLTFGVSFATLSTAIATYAPGLLNGGTSDVVTYTSQISYIAFTSTNTNALNQDLEGGSKDSLTSGTADYLSTFAALGASSAYLQPNGRVPEPATYAQVASLLFAAGLVGYRRRKAKRAERK
jgi:hypothetical protein